MVSMQLIQVAVFLAAAAIAAPLGRTLRMGSVIGYLAAGVVIGPFVFGSLYHLNDVEHILQFGEFGVVMLLFVIGLELRPVRFWSLRSSIFGLGASPSSLATAMVLARDRPRARPQLQPGAVRRPWRCRCLRPPSRCKCSRRSSELTTRHGRLAFSVLLFQDLAAIPLIALVPLFATLAASEPAWICGRPLARLGTIAGVVVVGRFLLSRLYRLVAATGVREAMTASALLTVVGVAIVMEAAGLSAALGAFIAGALLADSEYRHQIEADIAPFEGLLLAVVLHRRRHVDRPDVLLAKPLLLLAIVVGLVAMKARCSICSGGGGA